MDNIWFIAAIWIGLAFVASLISIRVGISVALIEILVGVAAGNIHFGGGQQILQSTDWTNFLAMLGSGVLTFLAGAEIDPVSLRANFRASMAIGIAAFLLPFSGVWLFAQFVLGWPIHQAQVAGIALSTTSVAVVYAVMIETRQEFMVFPIGAPTFAEALRSGAETFHTSKRRFLPARPANPPRPSLSLDTKCCQLAWCRSRR